MNVRAMMVVVGVSVMLLAACNGRQDELPTLIPTANDAAPTVAPSETALEAAITPSATATMVRTRPTLPPAFTPTTAPSETPTETEVFASPTLFVSGATADANCNTFDTNFDQSNVQFNVGDAPRASWQAVPGAQLYRVILKESNGRVINDQIYVAETTYTFDASLFANGKTYGWEVYPVNAANDQMCFAIGLELLPVTPSGIPGA